MFNHIKTYFTLQSVTVNSCFNVMGNLQVANLNPCLVLLRTVCFDHRVKEQNVLKWTSHFSRIDFTGKRTGCLFLWMIKFSCLFIFLCPTHQLHCLVPTNKQTWLQMCVTYIRDVFALNILSLVLFTWWFFKCFRNLSHLKMPECFYVAICKHLTSNKWY